MNIMDEFIFNRLIYLIKRFETIYGEEPQYVVVPIYFKSTLNDEKFIKIMGLEIIESITCKEIYDLYLL